MDKKMEELIDRYWDEDRHDQIVDLILSVPKEQRDIDMLGQLVVAYNNLEQYDKAIELSMELKEQSIHDAAWYYRISFAYVGKCDYEQAFFYSKKGMEIAKKNKNKERLDHCRGIFNECLLYIVESQNMKENEPLKIEWSEEEHKYNVVNGRVNLGYMGVYLCEQMEVQFSDYDYEILFSDEENEEAFSLRDYLTENMNHRQIAAGLTDYFNAWIQEIMKHLVQINQAFLSYVMQDMCDCGYQFWEECSSYVCMEKMPSCQPSDLYQTIYTKDVDKKMNEVFGRYYQKPLNKAEDNECVMEKTIEMCFPMFDYKKMLKDIYAENLVFSENQISFQCSGKGEAIHLVCAACAEIQKDLSFYDWHNF